LENRRVADQLPHPALQRIAARPDLFSRQGYVAPTYRCREGKTFGPYYCLTYREDGRQRSIYLGRPGTLVEAVRQALDACQQSRAQRRLLTRIERQVRASLRLQKFRLGALLRPFGLRLKGYEVRGWRISPLRRLLPPRRQLIGRISMRKPAARRHPIEDAPARLARFLSIRDGKPPNAIPALY
jgi:hypothetical protein